MPLGITRLNERTQRPNPLINFIKAPDPTSLDFLNRIAAQCYPIMKQHHISVMSLEEFPPNNEFLGRNFNAGEVIQLVLKDKSGRWLGFNFVQMVMMHELAHCKQMNHSKFFWQVRNGFAGEMEGLWAKKYSGEGMWGRGKELETGAFVRERELAQGDVPEHLCGGTYRRKGKKRKRGGQTQAGDDKPKLTYAERQQKRIAKKFGVHGEGAALGDDELLRGAYESASGKRHAGKPRVANSKRGRELRAQAALARFDAAKSAPVKEEPEIKQEPDDSETDSDWDAEDYEASGDVGEGDMIKVCGDEDEEEDGAHHEMDELRKMSQKAPNVDKNNHASGSLTRSSARKESLDYRTNNTDQDRIDSETESDAEGPVLSTRKTSPKLETDISTHNHVDSETKSDAEGPSLSSNKNVQGDVPHPTTTESAPALISDNAAPQSATPVFDSSAASTEPPGTCTICSLANDPTSPTCMACANVLHPNLMPDHWRCKSEACKDGSYINAGDAGRCGICGSQKHKSNSVSGGGNRSGGARPVGVIESDVLRWD